MGATVRGWDFSCSSFVGLLVPNNDLPFAMVEKISLCCQNVYFEVVCCFCAQFFFPFDIIVSVLHHDKILMPPCLGA